MSLMERRIENIMKAMKIAKDYEMKSIWSRKLRELFEVRGRKAFERLEDQARMVHQQSAGVGNFNNKYRINDCKYRNHG